jgi:hypothetical protein
MRYLLIHKSIKMKLLKNGIKMLLVLFIFSCTNEDNLSVQTSESDETSLSSFTYSNDQSLIQAVQDSIQSSIFSNITSNAGQPQWQCAYVEHSGFQFSKVVVPYKNITTGEIENLLVAFHFELNNTWKVQLVNKYYYLMMHDITKFDINREFYYTLIEEFDKADSICLNPSNNLAQTRLKNVMIYFEDGTIVWIDSQGRAWIIAGGGGCANGSSTAGSIWSDRGGQLLWTPGNNSTLGPKWNGNGTGGGISGNWNGSNTNGTGDGNNSGNSAGGGGSSTTAPTCQDPTFWSNIHPRIKKDYVKALSNLINQYDVITCADANTPAEQSNCISDTDLLCLGLNSGCLQVVGNQFDVNHFTDCMGAVFYRLPCMDEAQNFIETYGLDMTVEQLESLVGGFGSHCTDQDDFDNHVLDQLFKIELSKKPSGGKVINLGNEFKNCFGNPDSNGNYIDCSQTGNATFYLTLFAEQPKPGSRDPYSGNPITGIDVGHTFISLSTNYGGNQKTISFGFYPSTEVDLTNTTVPMSIYDDGGHDFSVSATIQLSCSQFNQVLINSVNATTNNYDLNNFNCTDYGYSSPHF